MISYLIINSSLLRLITFNANYSPQTANTFLICCPMNGISPIPAFYRYFDNLLYQSYFPKYVRHNSLIDLHLICFDFGYNCASEMKHGISLFSHSWLTRAECDGSESCRNVHGLWAKCLSAKGFGTLFKIFSLQHSVFILAQWLKDIRC